MPEEREFMRCLGNCKAGSAVSTCDLIPGIGLLQKFENDEFHITLASVDRRLGFDTIMTTHDRLFAGIMLGDPQMRRTVTGVAMLNLFHVANWKSG